MKIARISFLPIRIPVWLFLFCLSAPLAWSEGRISGTARDPSGAVVPGVQVTAVSAETGIRQSTVTDVQGFYAFPSLPVGHYDVNAVHAGFKEFKVTGLTLDVNSALQVDVPMELGQQTQQVSVAAAALQIETVNTQMGEVVTGSNMTSVPLNGRTYTDLLALQPGVAPYAGTYTGTVGAGSYSVSGNRESANGFMVNGGNVKEGVKAGTTILPNLDSLAEFRVITNNFDAEYGNYSGGVVNAITKSGTNQFHGDAFDFLRNTDFNARNFFSPGVSEYIQNQFGGTGGGPIKKDKLFFFADYQGTRIVQGQNTGKVLVPSAADRAGNVSDLASQLSGTVTGAFWANQLSQQLGYGVTPGERYYVPGCTVNSTCVFPNAIVPQSVITKPSSNLMKYIPLPNSGPYYVSNTGNAQSRDDKGAIRIDQSTNRLGLISWYYFIDDNHAITPSTFPGFNTAAQGRAQMLTMGDTKTLGTNKVNEFRLHYMRYVNIGISSGGIGVSLSSLGFVTGANTSGIVVQAPDVEGVPPITMANYSFGVSGAPLAGQYNGTYQLSDNFSWVKGAHTMKFGVNLHYDEVIRHDYTDRNGSFTFGTGQESGSDWVDFLMGAPSQYIQGAQLPLVTREHYLGLYAQDSWRVAPTVTLNYGLRWDITQPWYEARNELETIIPGEQSKVFPGAPVGWVFPGDPGVPSSMGYTRYHDFAPRVGIAWAPNVSDGILGRLLGGPAKTSIRAGFGLFYTSYEDQTSFQESGDAPYGFYWQSPTPPLFTTPFIDRSTGFNEGQRFPPQFPPIGVSPQHPDNSINWAFFEPIAGSPGFWHDNVTPYSEQYNLSIQRQLGPSTVLSVSYVGSQGHHLLSALQSNPGNPALCLSASTKAQVAPGSATCGPNGENGVYTLANGTVINGTRQPLGPAFGSDSYYITIANSAYNALETTLRHSSGPLEVLGGFTWSKSLDYASGYGGGIIPYNYALSRGYSTFDVPLNFVLSYHYELPFAHVFGRNTLARGWILSGITRFANGIPIVLTDSGDRSLLGTSYADRPNCAAGGNLNLAANNPRTGLPYFNTALFSRETIGQIGTCDSRIFHGPGTNNFDMALLKDVHLTESKFVQLRFEFFNVFNHAQFSNPSGSVTNATFGIVTTARAARVGQLALKFMF